MSMSYHMIMFAMLLYDTDYYKSKIFSWIIYDIND